MRNATPRVVRAFATALFVLSGVSAFAQTPPGSSVPPGTIRRLSIDDAVKLALEQNLGIQIDRMNPQIQDLAVAEARTGWIPSFTSSLLGNSQNQPSTSALSGGQTKTTDNQFSTAFGLAQTLKTGGNYAVSWNSARLTSTNLFTNYDPLLSSNFQFSFSQPLLRNYRIDNLRQALEAARKDREVADITLRGTIASTARNVKNAYWDLLYQIDNLQAQQQSLDLAKRLLADNEKRVQIGTMAPIDIVEAQSEVARNEEAVIVAGAAIQDSQDRLRALVYDPATPDFWNITIEPTESMPFAATEVDTNAAVQAALANRSDVLAAKNGLAKSEIDMRYYKNQSLPDVSAQASYQTNAVGGTVLSPVSLTSLGTPRTVVSERGFGSVLGDVVTSNYPTWTVGVSVTYLLGESSSEANLARARLQHSQAETQLKNLELQITTDVRTAARQVQTNQKRVDSARAARELAERRLEAEEKKFTAGIQISFFVFQAQRDLAQAKTNEIQAIADYNKSLVDLEAIQQTALK